jgi:two-component system response regulator DegU
MIVDDNTGTREMMRQFLDLPGISFCECADGHEALERVREFKPHWVTIDVNMPGLSGFKAAKALRKEHPPAQIMMVSAENDPHFPQLSRAAGAVGFIPKQNILALRLILMKEMESFTKAAERKQENGGGRN